MEEFEIYYKDLVPDVQKAFLDFVGLDDPKDGNFDVFPIAFIPKPEGDD